VAQEFGVRRVAGDAIYSELELCILLREIVGEIPQGGLNNPAHDPLRIVGDGLAEGRPSEHLRAYNLVPQLGLSAVSLSL